MNIKLKDIIFGSFGLIPAIAGFILFKNNSINSSKLYFILINYIGFTQFKEISAQKRVNIVP
jgi:hypothetical protein